MRMRSIVSAAVVSAAMLGAPSAARADWLLTPFIGTTFSGSATNEHLTYGGSLGFMGAGIVGFEVDFGYTPEFFQGDDEDFDLISDSNVTTLMANVIVGAPIGGDEGSVRPYFSGGAGLLRSSVADADEFFDVSNNDFGINFGGGVMAFFTDNVGIRGDVRYFRSLTDPESDNEFDIDFGSFDFWRATGGVTFRF
ncbi:MAG: outer membrane protein [Vicinamibacterales bacterium]